METHLVVYKEPVRLRLVRADVLVRCRREKGRVTRRASRTVPSTGSHSPSSILGSVMSAMDTWACRLGEGGETRRRAKREWGRTRERGMWWWLSLSWLHTRVQGDTTAI